MGIRKRNKNKQRHGISLKYKHAQKKPKHVARQATYTKQDNVIDFLDEDEIINNQQYGCISFASITDVMKSEIIVNISDQLKKPEQDIKEIVELWCKKEHPLRGVKIRGSYKTLAQAKAQADQLRQFDKASHIFVCSIGKWLTFDPSPELIEDENYMEEQLNKLLKGTKENKLKVKQQFEERKQQMLEKAILEGTPKGQEELIKKEEPYEAVKFRADNALETIDQLQSQIKELEQTRNIALKKLETMPVPDKKEGDDRVVTEMIVEKGKEEAPYVDLQAKKGVAQMREIQTKSKNIDLQEFAAHLQTQGVVPGENTQPPSQPQQIPREIFEETTTVPMNARKDIQEMQEVHETK